MRFMFRIVFILLALNVGCVPVTTSPATPTVWTYSQQDATPLTQTATATTIPQQATPSATATQVSEMPPRISRPTHPPKLARLIELGRAYLAEHLNLPVDQVALLDYQAIDWPDLSLGCPEPGLEYPQVITPGYSLFFQVERILYEVHTDQHGKHIRLCNEPLLIGPIPVKPLQSGEELAERARELLANMLRISPEEVEVVSIEAAEWEDDALGCPRPPGVYPDRAYPRPIQGFIILLKANEQTYEFHTDGIRLLQCPSQ